MAITRADFPLPDLDDARTAPFFEGAAAGELRIPRCESCDRLVWYPADECRQCGGSVGDWVATSGRGTLFSWVVVRRAFLPAFEQMVPFVSALVALDDDPAVRVATYLVDCEHDALRIDMPVVAVFRPLSFPTVPDREVVVPMFVPA